MSVFTPVGSAGSSSSVAFTGVTTPSITNITSTGSEQSYALPANTREFAIQSRGLTTLTLAYSSGASDVVTIHRGCVYSRSDIDVTASVTLYFTAADAGQVIEIESWA